MKPQISQITQIWSLLVRSICEICVICGSRFLLCAFSVSLCLCGSIAVAQVDHTATAYKLLGERKLDEARMEFAEALKANPKDLKAHVGLAAVYQGQGKLPQAVEEYRA